MRHQLLSNDHGRSVSSDHALVSHETASVLNSPYEDAEISITLFLTNREPCGPYRTKVGARRTLLLRFNDLTDPEPVPRNASNASVIEIDGADSRTEHQT